MFLRLKMRNKYGSQRSISLNTVLRIARENIHLYIILYIINGRNNIILVSNIAKNMSFSLNIYHGIYAKRYAF